MSRTTTALLALCTMVLTGCSPTADDVLSMATTGSTKTYDDALALREDIIATGIQCPGTEQRVVPAEDGTAYLECDNGMMAMAVADNDEDMEVMVNNIDNTGIGSWPILHAANWMVTSRHEAPLRQLEEKLGGTIIPAP